VRSARLPYPKSVTRNVPAIRALEQSLKSKYQPRLTPSHAIEGRVDGSTLIAFRARFAMRFAKLAICISTLLGGGGHAVAAPGDTIGDALVVVDLVTAQLEKSEQRKLAAGDGVRQQDLIEVSANGRGELKLRDDTKLALGPGSRLLLDQFVYDPELSGGAIVLDLAKGAFRFVTGVAAKPAYVIRTPTASVTVRGTIFDIYVQANGMSWLLLIEGAVQACSKNGTCRVLDEPGKLIRLTPDGGVGAPVRWAEMPGRQDIGFESAFPFVVNAPQIDPKPIFTREQIVFGSIPEHPNRTHDTEPNRQTRHTDNAHEPSYRKTRTVDVVRRIHDRRVRTGSYARRRSIGKSIGFALRHHREHYRNHFMRSHHH
jgi:hypothetical protein